MEVVWDEVVKFWIVIIVSGNMYKGDVVIGVFGQFNCLNWFVIDGKDSFQGVMMYLVGWDYLIVLDGKKVGIIGSVVSVVQIIFEVVEVVEYFIVFQCSLNWVILCCDIVMSVEEGVFFGIDLEFVMKIGVMNC